MKTSFLGAVVVAAILAGAGCSQSDQSTTRAEGKPAANQKGVDIEVSYSHKQDFVDKMKSQLADVNAEIGQLTDKLKDAGADAKAKMQPKVDELRDRAKNLDINIDKTQNATESTWDEVKTNSRKAMDDAKQSFHDARVWLSEKIAPK